MPDTTVTVTAGMPTTVTVTGGVADVTIDVQRGVTGATGATGAQGDRAGLKYTFDDQTNASTPSPGHLKFNSSTLSAVTRISIRDTDFDGNNTSALLGLIDDSNSTIKARIVIRSNSNADASHFNFLVTSVTDEGNHHHINGTYVSGSAFTANEIVTFDFYQTGDKGEQGATGATGAAGPNTVTTSTTTNITGIIKGNGSVVSQAVAGTDYAAALGANDNYVTDAQLVVIGNTSGTNTGDQFTSVTSQRLIGRHAGGSGAAQEVQVGDGIEFQGSGIRRSALTGDVTASAGSNATTLASTIAGAKTLSGQLELTGQAATTANSAMTKSLTLDLEHVQQQLKIPLSDWAKTNTGSGSTSETPGALRLYTGVTTLSTSLARANSGSLLMMNKPGTNVNFNEIPWGSRVRVSFKTMLIGADANTIARYQFGESFSKTTVSDLDQKGFGIKIENLSVKCLAHNGTILTTSAALFTATQYRMFTVLFDSDGAGNVNLYINGTSVGTTTGGPTTAGTTNNTAINVSATNGAGISGLLQYLGGEIIWQID